MKELISEYGLSIITVIVIVVLITLYIMFGGIVGESSENLGKSLGDIDITSIVEDINEK